MSQQLDNHDLATKVSLRRYFLKKYHAEPPRVLDCCQGQGLVWRLLRREFELSSYWGLDLKVKKGRLRIDSVRVLGQAGWPEDVIDIDTYGSPWKHWLALLPNVRRPLTVFLTVGRGGPNRIRLGREEYDALGLTLGRVRGMSGSVTHRLSGLAMRYTLAEAHRHDVRLVEVLEAVTNGNARYVG